MTANGNKRCSTWTMKHKHMNQPIPPLPPITPTLSRIKKWNSTGLHLCLVSRCSRIGGCFAQELSGVVGAWRLAHRVWWRLLEPLVPPGRRGAACSMRHALQLLLGTVSTALSFYARFSIKSFVDVYPTISTHRCAFAN